MTESSFPKRREFLGRLAAGAVAIGLGGTMPRALAAEAILASRPQARRQVAVIVEGKTPSVLRHAEARQRHGPHSRAQLSQYSARYLRREAPGRHGRDRYLRNVHAAGVQRRNVGEVRPRQSDQGDGRLEISGNLQRVLQGAGGCGEPVLSGAPIGIPADSSISSLQQRGGVFLLCNNAFNVWMGILGGGDAAKAAALRTEFEANMLPGIFLVPAMVVAVNQAQTHGCTYMYL